MNEKRCKLIIGALLHDIGKVVYREGNVRKKHSIIGYEFLKDEVSISDAEILHCVRYHHYDALKDAKNLSDDALLYIVYMADNIASAIDRRDGNSEETGFDMALPLKPVFNLLNGNDGDFHYSPYRLNEEKEINFPTETNVPFSKEQYAKIVGQIADNLKGIEWNAAYLNSLLEVLEGNLSYVPSSTNKQEVPDISLYDHLKMTAALASCMQSYLDDQNITDYKAELFTNGRAFYEKDAFLLATLDISGIQKFIYTITTKNALKTLRARSFYLEILLENLIDELLEELELTRANRIYSGGGHCYLLLPNTENAKKCFDEMCGKTNEWLLSHFQEALFVAGAYMPCSSNRLKNEPDGSYAELFQELSKELSRKKQHRYTAKQILALNQSENEDYTRECVSCKRIGTVNENGVCVMCEAFANLSKNILTAEFFSVVPEDDAGIPLPNGGALVSDSETSLKERMQTETIKQIYGVNRMFTGQGVSAKLWVGNYAVKGTLEELADMAEGVPRIAVLRADVDNLGHAFVAGFQNEKNQNRYVTISRTATLSRQLSLFFKLYINTILKEKDRKAAIVYSGGDDLFIVGAWDDVLSLALDIRNAFFRYTEGTLTISAGIGIYAAGYPISVIAEEVARLEKRSKDRTGKDAVTVFEDDKDATYSWVEWEEKVVGEKMNALEAFFSYDDYGNSFLYHLLELIRHQDERINFARAVYLLSRMEPDANADKERKEAYKAFVANMVRWIQNEDDRKQLKTAMQIFVYRHRERKEETA